MPLSLPPKNACFYILHANYTLKNHLQSLKFNAIYSKNIFFSSSIQQTVVGLLCALLFISIVVVVDLPLLALLVIGYCIYLYTHAVFFFVEQIWPMDHYCKYFAYMLDLTREPVELDLTRKVHDFNGFFGRSMKCLDFQI